MISHPLINIHLRGPLKSSAQADIKIQSQTTVLCQALVPDTDLLTVKQQEDSLAILPSELGSARYLIKSFGCPTVLSLLVHHTVMEQVHRYLLLLKTALRTYRQPLPQDVIMHYASSNTSFLSDSYEIG